jgi:hypothetical protein
MGQLFISAQCLYESLGFPTERNNVLNLVVVTGQSLFSTMFKESKLYYERLPCMACPNGVLYEFNDSMSSYHHFWSFKIQDNTCLCPYY